MCYYDQWSITYIQRNYKCFFFSLFGCAIRSYCRFLELSAKTIVFCYGTSAIQIHVMEAYFPFSVSLSVIRRGIRCSQSIDERYYIWIWHSLPGILQVPVAPLRRGDGPSSFLPQNWNNETHDFDDCPPEKGIPTMITWAYGGNSVLVEGSWDNWKSR